MKKAKAKSIKQKAATNRVKLGNIMNNPFRDFKTYPLDENRIGSLISSIKSEDFWGGLLARPYDDTGKMQIAFGHHRVEAAKRVYGLKHEIDIKVKELGDADMIRLLGKENDPKYDCPTMAIDDAVEAARKYLTSHPKEARALLSSGGAEVKRVKIGAPVIAIFIGKSVNAVEASIERLNLVEEGTVSREALNICPSAASADAFMKVIKEYDVKCEFQVNFAEHVKRLGRWGKRSMVDVLLTEIPQYTEKKAKSSTDAVFAEEHLKQSVKLMGQLRRELNLVLKGFDSVTLDGGEITALDITDKTRDKYSAALLSLSKMTKELLDGLNTLSNTFKKVSTKIEKEK